MFEYPLPASTLPNLAEWKAETTREEYLKVNPDADVLHSLKDELNASKHRLDEIYAGPDRKKYIAVLKNATFLEALRGPKGIMATKFGAGRLATKAYLKMFELCKFIDEYLAAVKTGGKKPAKSGPTTIEETRVISAYNARRKIGRGSPQKHLRSLHLAEAPGAFLAAIHHHLRTNQPNVEWSWIAESYRDIYVSQRKREGTRRNAFGEEEGYLGDKFGIMREFSDRWYYGADGDGDITSVANLKSFEHYLIEKWGKNKLDLLTSDVKYVPEVVDYDEEEANNYPVHLGHTIAAIYLPKVGGMSILKVFSFFEHTSVCMLQLLSGFYEKVIVTKPLTSAAINSEVYVVCMNKHTHPSKMQLEQLFACMKSVRANPFPLRSIFSTTPEGFLDAVIELNKVRVKQQVDALDRVLEFFADYKNKPEQILIDFGSARDEMIKKWLTLYSPKHLPKSDSFDFMK